MLVVIRNAAQLISVSPAGAGVASTLGQRGLGIIENGAVLIRDGQIEWVGRSEQLPPLQPDVQTIDASGQIVLPGFVDSHTHLIFAGSREDEFEQRLQGLSYQEIAVRGGGISATVRRVLRGW